MLPGIYIVRIESPKRPPVFGLAVIDTAKINGGDEGALYRGHYQQDAAGTVTANVEITNWSGKTSPIFGAFKQLHLTLKGPTQPLVFMLTGTVKEQPLITVTVHGEKKADLA